MRERSALTPSRCSWLDVGAFPAARAFDGPAAISDCLGSVREHCLGWPVSFDGNALAGASCFASGAFLFSAVPPFSGTTGLIP
jgi:hypothetical protein